LHGELTAAEHVHQEFWAQRLGVSRAPTREAMKMLVIERLLTYDPHRGYFVSRLDPHEMSQVYLIRQTLETEVLRTIRWPDETELLALHKIADGVLERLQADDVHGALDAARALSFAIWDLSPLEFLANEVKRYWAMADVYRALSMDSSRSTDPNAEGLRRHHKELFAALESHDRERMIQHNRERRASMVGRWGESPAGEARSSVDLAEVADAAPETTPKPRPTVRKPVGKHQRSGSTSRSS